MYGWPSFIGVLHLVRYVAKNNGLQRSLIFNSQPWRWQFFHQLTHQHPQATAHPIGIAYPSSPHTNRYLIPNKLCLVDTRGPWSKRVYLQHEVVGSLPLSLLPFLEFYPPSIYFFYDINHVRNGQGCDMKGIWNPTCLEMDNVWWSPKFCPKRTQTYCPIENEGDHVTKFYLYSYNNSKNDNNNNNVNHGLSPFFLLIALHLV